MSKATPYIAKITISTSTGPYTDTAAASSTFAIYDNSGAAPGLEVPFVSTCVLRSCAVAGAARMQAANPIRSRHAVIAALRALM